MIPIDMSEIGENTSVQRVALHLALSFCMKMLIADCSYIY